MSDYVIIDVHTHTYRTAEIGRQAMEIGQGGWTYSTYSGTVPELLELMGRAEIRYTCMLNMTPVWDMRRAAIDALPTTLTPAQREAEEVRIAEAVVARLRRRNEWTCQVAHEAPSLVPFMSLDPSMSAVEMRDEVERCVRLGARGLKLHPLMQHYRPTEPLLWPVYELCQEEGLPIIFHSGTFGDLEASAPYARPKAFEEILISFPELTVVLAHLGRGYIEETFYLAERYGNVCFDTCGTITAAPVAGRLEDTEAVAAIRRIGAERVFFGSDYPWFDPVADSKRLLSLPGLTEEERRAILGENAKRLFGL